MGFNERGASLLTTSGKRPEPVEMRDFRTVDFEDVIGSNFERYVTKLALHKALK